LQGERGEQRERPRIYSTVDQDEDEDEDEDEDDVTTRCSLLM
jgi:hypothetical protein